MNIRSDFAVLDVKSGREQLTEHFEQRPTFGECPQHLRIPVVVHGYIDGIHSKDDGVSREFSMHVETVVVAA